MFNTFEQVVTQSEIDYYAQLIEYLSNLISNIVYKSNRRLDYTSNNRLRVICRLYTLYIKSKQWHDLHVLNEVLQSSEALSPLVDEIIFYILWTQGVITLNKKSGLDGKLYYDYNIEEDLEILNRCDYELCSCKMADNDVDEDWLKCRVTFAYIERGQSFLRRHLYRKAYDDFILARRSAQSENNQIAIKFSDKLIQIARGYMNGDIKL